MSQEAGKEAKPQFHKFRAHALIVANSDISETAGLLLALRPQY